MPGSGVKTAEDIRRENELEAAKKAEAEKKRQQALSPKPRPVANSQSPEDEKLSPTNFTAKGPAPALKSLVEAYIAQFKDKKFYKEPIADPTKGACVLTFETTAQATEFFDTQAKSGMKFLCQEEGKGFDGLNFFSCGDKKLYKGSVQQIMDALNESLAAANTPEQKQIISDGLETFKQATSHATKRFRDALPPREAPVTAPSPSPVPKTR